MAAAPRRSNPAAAAPPHLVELNDVARRHEPEHLWRQPLHAAQRQRQLQVVRKDARHRRHGLGERVVLGAARRRERQRGHCRRRRRLRAVRACPLRSPDVSNTSEQNRRPLSGRQQKRGCFTLRQAVLRGQLVPSTPGFPLLSMACTEDIGTNTETALVGHSQMPRPLPPAP